jgi:hypothetical protein
METAGRPLGRDRTAIAASIALHLCAVIALATLPRASFPVDDPDERLLLASQIRVEHRPPARAVLVRRALAPRADTAKPAIRPVIHTAVAVERAARRLVVAPEAHNAYAPSMSASAAPAPPREADSGVGPSRVAAAATTQGAAEASPAPLPAPSAAPTSAAQGEEGVGNFGETYPASIEPTLRSALVAVGSGFVVRVTVDENGRATAIEFMRAPPDATLREALREKLLAARFIPAACNGLRCAGTVELRT